MVAHWSPHTCARMVPDAFLIPLLVAKRYRQLSVRLDRGPKRVLTNKHSQD